MFTFTGIAISERLGKQFDVEDEWENSSRSWTGGIVAKQGKEPLPMGYFTLS
jgi:hypothetical protein